MTRQTTILLIDDEDVVREELGGILEDEGYRVLAGADGEEGLALFRAHGPDIVITDVRMPRRDGLSVAMAIRQQAPHVPVTVITGHGTEAMAIEALRAGVTDFIKKPVRLEDLAAALTRMEAARLLAMPHANLAMPAAVESMQRVWRYTLRNEMGAIPAFVEAMLKQCAKRARLEAKAQMELSLALRELLLNALEHGNLGLSFADKTEALESGTLEALLRSRATDPRYVERRITVETTLQPSLITVSIEDMGEGFDWNNLADPLDPSQQLASHGRGILLARMSVDTLEYNATGNRVTVTKRLGRNPARQSG